MIFSKPTNFVYVIYLFILMVCLASLGHFVIIAFFFHELEIFIHKTPTEL